MRADAERNRALIVEAARRAIDDGRTPPMSTIAHQAGVGQGTLYRHFPTWPDLVMAVHRADVARLVGAAPLLLENNRPLPALRLWLQQLAEYGRIKHGLSEALHADLADEGRLPIVEAIQLFLTAGVDDGTIRPDVDGGDLLLMLGFLWRLDLEPDRDTRAARLLEVTLHGLRPSEDRSEQPSQRV